MKGALALRLTVSESNAIPSNRPEHEDAEGKKNTDETQEGDSRVIR